MSPLNFTHILTQAVDELSESESYKGLFHQHTDGNPLPSAKELCDIIELARAIIFPGYFGNSTVNSRTVTYHIGVNVERLFDNKVCTCFLHCIDKLLGDLQRWISAGDKWDKCFSFCKCF